MKVSLYIYIGAVRELAPLAVLMGLAVLMPGQFAAADDATAPEAAAPEIAPTVAPDAAPTPALVRVSSSFEVKHAGAVLKQVAKLFSAGFVRKDAERVAAEIDAQPAEQSRSWDFSALYKGNRYALRVRARLDEFGDLDMDFFSAPEISAAVRGAVDRYLNGRGL
ncbi:MAG TPA: hypothetical protein VHN17_03225 [Steroidobacteraceae bacterium]|jgi:hypothetical protein|nr:hypothetical protein [Steroidobacteraceae bacterium]